MDNDQEDQHEGIQMDRTYTGTGGKSGGGSNAMLGIVQRPISPIISGKIRFLHLRMMFSFGC